jgi:hypothetical protein
MPLLTRVPMAREGDGRAVTNGVGAGQRRGETRGNVSHSPRSSTWATAPPGLLDVLAHQLGQLEHRDGRFPAKNGLQRGIRVDPAFVLGVL